MKANNDEKFVSILHSSEYLSTAKIQKLWDIICGHAEGIDVEATRTEFGYSNSMKEKRKTVNRLQFTTKGKIGGHNWDAKSFQIEYLFGLRLQPPSARLRKGVNAHLMEELFGKMYVDNREYYQDALNKLEPRDIRNFIREELKRILTGVLSQSVGEDIQLERLIDYFDKEESQFFKTAVEKITDNYMHRYAYLKSIKTKDIWDMLFPMWNELVLWDTEEWTNGKVDSMFNTGMRNVVLPVDYKFGKPKEKYYMPSIELELTFYKMLLESQNAVWASDYFGDRQKWEPKSVDQAAMWYILDTPEHGMITVDYTNERKNERMMEAYHSSIYEYWNAMNNMDYGFKKFYGYNKNRFIDYCQKVDINDNYDCAYRPVCERMSSFIEENFLDEL